MTREQAEGIRDLALEEGLDALFLNALPLGGYNLRGRNIGKPRSGHWYFSATIRNSDDKARLVCTLARAGATRENTDMIRDRNTYRITRIG